MITKGTFTRYYNSYPSYKLPKLRLLTGLFAALSVSFSYYAFFYVMREGLRFVVLYPEYEPLILSNQEIYFYNFIFALIGSVFGLSTFLRFCFPSNRFWKEPYKHYYRRMNIDQDLTALNSIFLYWFGQMTFVMGFSLGMVAAFCAFSLYPAFNIVWIFIVAVLFMENWKTIRRVAFLRSRYWIAVSLLFIIIWSVLLSCIRLLDDQSLNNLSIPVRYKVELPISRYYRIIHNRSLRLDISVLLDRQDNVPVIFINRTKTDMDNLQSAIDAYKRNYSGNDLKLLTCINADVNIPLKYIRHIENNLAETGLDMV